MDSDIGTASPVTIVIFGASGDLTRRERCCARQWKAKHNDPNAFQQIDGR